MLRHENVSNRYFFDCCTANVIIRLLLTLLLTYMCSQAAIAMANYNLAKLKL